MKKLKFVEIEFKWFLSSCSWGLRKRITFLIFGVFIGRGLYVVDMLMYYHELNIIFLCLELGESSAGNIITGQYFSEVLANDQAVHCIAGMGRDWRQPSTARAVCPLLLPCYGTSLQNLFHALLPSVGLFCFVFWTKKHVCHVWYIVCFSSDFRSWILGQPQESVL